MANRTEGYTKTQLYYETVGQGTPIVFVHAGIADHSMWDEQFEAFAEHYRVIRYDMRGYGQSEAATQAFSHHEDLESLLAFLNTDKAHLIGVSEGSATLVDFALQYPSRVLSLSLISPSVGGYEFEGPPPPKVLELFSALEHGNWEQVTELAAQIWVDGPERRAEQVDQSVRNQVKTMSKTALGTMNPAIIQPTPLDPPAVTRLGELDVSTQIIVGDLDDASIAAIAEHLVTEIKGANKKVIKNAAHMLSMEQPQVFNQAVLTFLHAVD